MSLHQELAFIESKLATTVNSRVRELLVARWNAIIVLIRHKVG